LKHPALRSLRFSGNPAPVRVHALLPLCALLVAAGIAGCAQTGAMRNEPAAIPEAPARAPAPQPGMPAHAEPPPPGVNLSGFPLAYRQGYADGCASVGGTERKDVARYGADGNYRTGWQDGLALCRRK
jgi:hypothetical protein